MLHFETLSPEAITRHWPELAGIEASVGWEQWTLDQFLSPLPQKFSFSIAARLDEETVGFAVGSRKGHAAHLHRIVVHKDHRGSGLGRALLAEFVRNASAADPDVTICSLKVEKNNPARKLYLDTGFRLAVSSVENGHDNLWMPIPGRKPSVAAHQPNYIPWHGYFAKMAKADVFVILDDVQMPQGRSYVSRTGIRLGEEDRWLTVPVTKKSSALINEIMIADEGWAVEHANLLKSRYGKWPGFGEAMSVVEPALRNGGKPLWLSNMTIIEALARRLGIKSTFVLSSDMPTERFGDDRLIDLVNAVGGDHYISGSGGMNYQSVAKFNEAGIAVSLNKFAPPSSDAAAYPRRGLSVLEAIFGLGFDGAAEYISSTLDEAKDAESSREP